MAQGTPQYLLYDGHGSVRQLANLTGAVTGNYHFDAYGQLLARSNTPATNILYVGQMRDTTTGHYNNWHRWYDPSIGLFDRIDDYAGNNYDPISLHKYLYCGANPVNAIDPSGNEYSLANVTTAISIIGMQASQYISRVPSMAVAAFRSGGQAIGTFFNQFGPRSAEFWPASHQVDSAD